METTQKPFDLQTHKWDRTGRKLIEENLYTLHCVSDRKYFERPVDSGNLWYESGAPAGRLIYKYDAKGKKSKEFMVGDNELPHVVYVAPLTGDAKVAAELTETRNQLEQAKSELTQIRAEQTRKTAPAAKKE